LYFINHINKEKYLKYQENYRNLHRKELNNYFKKRYQEKKEILLKKYKEYREQNIDKIKESKHREYLKHKQKYLDRAKKRTRTHKNEITEYKKNYYNLNKANIIKKEIQRKKERIKVDINFKILCNLRTRLWWALKNNSKYFRTIELIDCSIKYLKQYLESKFQPGMTWNNYGKWHIDHIKPCASFNLQDPTEQKKCFNYTNLQPLWAKENLKKSDKII
jgi:hypothetical protein